MKVSLTDLVKNQKVLVSTGGLKIEKIETIKDIYFGLNSGLLKIEMESGETYEAEEILEVR